MQLHSNTGQATSEQVGTFDAVHTPENPYCGNYPCWCHDSSNYHAVVISSHSELSTHEITDSLVTLGVWDE